MKNMSQVEDRDRLTGLIGSDAAKAQIVEWLSAVHGAGKPPAVHAMLLGLRRFESINVAFGAAAGDRALVEVAARLLHFARREMEGNWLVARIGGGTFLIASTEACNRERWHWLAEELAQAVAMPILGEGSASTVRLWPRVALLRAAHEEEPERMLDRLAETLDRAQNQTGRRLLWVDRKMTPAGRPSQQLEADLLAAVDRDEIEILFQPQYDSESGRIVGAEALARWQHPELGRIGADALFSIADRADHIAQLSSHIARKALTASAKWDDHLRLSLNVTTADLVADDYAQRISAMLADTSFPPDRLTLEITEHALLTELDRSAQRLRELSALGIRIALDDFGAGFCNFRYLKALPLDYLKLDRSMVDGIVDDPRDLVVLRGILAMASALDLGVIAEGIESESQRALASREGCSVWQGFLGSQPLSNLEFELLAGA